MKFPDTMLLLSLHLGAVIASGISIGTKEFSHVVGLGNHHGCDLAQNLCGGDGDIYISLDRVHNPSIASPADATVVTNRLMLAPFTTTFTIPSEDATPLSEAKTAPGKKSPDVENVEILAPAQTYTLTADHAIFALCGIVGAMVF